MIDFIAYSHNIFILFSESKVIYSKLIALIRLFLFFEIEIIILFFKAIFLFHYFRYFSLFIFSQLATTIHGQSCLFILSSHRDLRIQQVFLVLSLLLHHLESTHF